MDGLTLDSTCGTCHCYRGNHFKTYDGRAAGCVRKIGITNPIPCACLGFMATESESLRAAHEAEMGRRIFQAVVARQDAEHGPLYRKAAFP